MSTEDSMYARTELADALGRLLESGWANTVDETDHGDGTRTVTGRFTLYIGDCVNAFRTLPRGLVNIDPAELAGSWTVRVDYNGPHRDVTASRDTKRS